MAQFLNFGNGSDGVLTISSNTTESPTDSSCSGTSGTTSLSATNASFAVGQMILIHQTRGTGVGAWEINWIAGYTAGTITTQNALINTYTDSGNSQAQVRVLPQYKDVNINSGFTYTSKAWNANIGGILAFVCNGTVTVEGNITATGKGFVGGANGNNSGAYLAWSGEGSAGVSVENQTTANGNGGGGGAQGLNKAGGGSNGTQGQGVGAGSTSGSADLTTMTFGGGGGGLSKDNPTSGDNGAIGGGIILIFAKEIIVTGTIVNNGNNSTSAGGGGGGSTFLKGQDITLGSALITATGGTSGNTSNGGSGRIRVEACNITGTTSPSASESEGGFDFCAQTSQIL